MKANEFVKRFGLERAKQFVNADHTAHALVFATTGVSFIDLKRLVESLELVEKLGGLISSKKYLKFLQSSVDMGLYHGLDDVDYKTEIPLIKQAIADVESCQ